MKKIRKKERQYIYDYFYSDQGQIQLIEVFEKKTFFKKPYGCYEFQYTQNNLTLQTSKVYGHGITESIAYHYDAEQKLTQKLYYSEKNQIRYTVTFQYQGKTPFQMDIVRMEQFPFFTTQDSKLIQKMLEVHHSDFDGAFFLLDLVEQAGK